ncbi:histidine--tRNA ligase [candidate division KSB1 bacterium]|nr:histidine--tRNA ligase [candidate division KSB1 bacterium]NIR72555.1 histidine--tRNA ligase [candidate division KSB1 bacterium]NIS27307.1 histidine--tRNA ligase [candidate division KSB1 bacterium]NIT73517.1 histidine--tRNA ligase [candidate division KSB1 bacterium]NIU28037.1 histidine--tRNA ligase [candidate division KSB1 bacterium]
MAAKPNLPKGTRDFLPEQMFRRQYAMNLIREIFEKYGYEPLETPSIERLDVLSGKYGDEGEKLIFKVLKRGTGLENLLHEQDQFVVRKYQDLVDEALRYDLTVPLSRVVAMHQHGLVFPFKRYQIQPVWRADRPQRGRYREFYQCDVDTVGTESMLADAEAIVIVYEVLTALGFKNFRLRINNRKILNGILHYAEVKPEAENSALITIDKLEKIGFDGVKNELQEKGLTATSVNRIFSILEITGKPKDLLSELRNSFSEIDSLRDGADELEEICDYLPDFGVPDAYYDIDLFLARGLGYYTGPIHESIVEEPKIGSLSGGGRYDQLIGMFLGRDIPATGVAFGIERIIDVMAQLDMFPPSRTKTRALVTIFDETTRATSLKFSQELRKSDVPTESVFDPSKLKKQFTYADKRGIPFVVIIGPEELAQNRVTIKEMKTGEQKTLDWGKAVEFLRER